MRSYSRGNVQAWFYRETVVVISQGQWGLSARLLVFATFLKSPQNLINNQVSYKIHLAERRLWHQHHITEMGKKTRDKSGERIRYNSLWPAAFVFAPFKVVARQNLLSVIKFRVIECKCLGVGGAASSLLSKGGKTGSSCTTEKVLTEAQGTCLVNSGN